MSFGKPGGNIRLGIPRHWWEDNIKMNLKYGIGMWTGFIRLVTGFGDMFL
jgi:hypothetical protein